tara:strand:- start:8817 stop:10484 length:1668 start_codon:yes stop_codon:yes gene_type:complete
MIAICQSKDEVNLIKKNYKDLPIILALNLETITFCKLNKINFILPFENISYHSISKKILLNSKKLLDSIDFKILQYDFLINDLKAIVRYKFHQIAFLIEIIQNLENTNQKIIYTDLYSTSKFFDKDYINIDQTLDLLNINNLKKIKIGNKHKSLKENKIFEYKISGLRYLDEKKVILNNAGYNFKRFFLYFLKKRVKIAIPETNLGYFKKFFFKLIGFELYNFEKIREIKDLPDEPQIRCNFFYRNHNISKILNNEIKSAQFYLSDLQEKYKSLIKYIDKSNPKLVLCNTNRDLGSILLEVAVKKNINSIIVSHGTVSQSFDEFDKIYKEYIAEGVFLGNSKYKAVQSKIAKKFAETQKINRSLLETGNLIFSENLDNINLKKKNILYAVTSKRLPALQVHGVEYFFEFYKNLQIIDNFSLKYNLSIIVHLHPGAKKNIEDFKKIFKNLIFKTGDISDSLKKSFMTISYSSTVIEDSLYNKVPVVLLDLHKKNYLHLDCEKNPKEKNKAVYYLNNIADLKTSIDTIKNSKNVNFEEYIFNTRSKKNIEKLLNSHL